MKLFFLIVCGVTFSCADNGANPLSSSDSLVIQFELSQEGVAGKTISSTEKNAIKKITNFLNGEQSLHTECDVDCKLLFYKKNSLIQVIDFNYKDNVCKSFHLVDSVKVNPTIMSNEAAAFFKGLAEGKSWY